jgi:hypothetical protein
MERDANGYEDLDIAQVRGVGALSFVDLKMRQVGEQVSGIDPAYDWRQGRPTLSRWYGVLSVDPVFQTPLLPWD